MHRPEDSIGTHCSKYSMRPGIFATFSNEAAYVIRLQHSLGKVVGSMKKYLPAIARLVLIERHRDLKRAHNPLIGKDNDTIHPQDNLMTPIGESEPELHQQSKCAHSLTVVLNY